MIKLLGIYKKHASRHGVASQLSLPFPGGNGLHGKVTTSNISGALPPIFFIVSPCVWEDDRLLNENYWGYLDIIDHAHSKYTSRHFAYLGYPSTILTNFWRQFQTASCQQQKRIISSYLENVAKIAVSQLLYDRSLPIFYGTDGNVVGDKNVISADLENIGQGHHLKKIIISQLLYTDFNHYFTKCCNWNWLQKRHISWPLKCRSGHISTNNISYHQINFNHFFRNDNSATGVVAFVCRPSFIYPW